MTARLRRALLVRPASHGEFAAAGWRAAPDSAALRAEHGPSRSCSTVLASRSRSFRHQTGSSTRVTPTIRSSSRGPGPWCYMAKAARAAKAGLPRSRARADRRSARRPPARAGRRGWRRHALARRAHARRRARVPDERRRAPAARGATRGRRRDGRALRPAARPRPGVRPAPAECRLTSRGRPRAGARAAPRFPCWRLSTSAASGACPARPRSSRRRVATSSPSHPVSSSSPTAIPSRGALDRAGCDVHVYRAAELNKGDGGPTCLTRPVLRAA